MPPPKKKLSERRRRRLQKLTVWRVVILLVVLGLMVLAGLWPLPYVPILLMSALSALVVFLSFDPTKWFPFSHLVLRGYVNDILFGRSVADAQVVNGLYRVCIFGSLFVAAIIGSGDDVGFVVGYGMGVGGLLGIYIILVVYGIREGRAAHGLPRSRGKPFLPFPTKA